MSEPAAAATGGPSWKLTTVVAGIMVVLALLGVALATTNVRLARNYWVALVPIYGGLCTVTAWRSQRSGELPVLRQVLHWVGIAGAVALDFYIRGTGVETQTASGLDALMLLALGCYLAGVHLDWLFVGVGLLLTITLLVVAKADQYLWLLLVVGVVAIGALLGVRRMRAGSS
jgi:hypothetical protein